MMNKYGIYTFLGIIVSLTSLVQADPTDFLRRPQDREDYSQPTEQSGLLHQTYETESGERVRRFAPVESILGIGRRNNNNYNEYSQPHTSRRMQYTNE